VLHVSLLPIRHLDSDAAAAEHQQRSITRPHVDTLPRSYILSAVSLMLGILNERGTYLIECDVIDAWQRGRG
jgi:hypothetical protein